jgi:hypothetical protein
MIHLSEDQLVLHYYGEVRGNDVETHLDACDECRHQYRTLQRVLNAVDTYPVPERDAGYGAQLWQRLEGQLPKTRRRPWLFSFPGRWIAAAAFSMLLIGAFMAGRMSRTPSKTVVAEIPSSLQSGGDSRILLTAVGNHLDRSQMLLVELANSGKYVDSVYQQSDVRDLIDANRLYRSSASQAGERAVTEVLDELERLLLEVAHLAPSLTPEAADELRQRITGQGILLRVRIVGSEVREREKNADVDLPKASL